MLPRIFGYIPLKALGTASRDRMSFSRGSVGTRPCVRGIGAGPAGSANVFLSIRHG